MAIIRIKRLSRPIGAWTKVQVFIDDVCVGKLRDDEKDSYVIPAGNHSVYVKAVVPSNVVYLDLKNHESVNLVVSSKESEGKQSSAIFFMMCLAGLVPYMPSWMPVAISAISVAVLAFAWKTNRLFKPLYLRCEETEAG